MGEYELFEIFDCRGGVSGGLFIHLKLAGFGDLAILLAQLEDIETAAEIRQIHNGLGADTGLKDLSAEEVKYLDGVGFIRIPIDFEIDKRDGRVGVKAQDLDLRLRRSRFRLAVGLGGC